MAGNLDITLHHTYPVSFARSAITVFNILFINHIELHLELPSSQLQRLPLPYVSQTWRASIHV